MVRVKALLDSIDQQGWGFTDGYWDKGDSLRLRNECEKACKIGDFKQAGIGKAKTAKINEGIRSDQILWLSPEAIFPEQQSYLAQVEILRLALNERFFLGLFDYESHFALYPEGGFYKAHLDCHAGSNARVFTIILYLNEEWIPGDGGELKLWTTCGEKEGDFVLIEPKIGTLLCFPSADYWHEVLPTLKSRRSITGWFRRS